MTMTAQLASKTLYEQDYYLWLETTCQQLQQIVEAQNITSLPHLDWEHFDKSVLSVLCCVRATAKYHDYDGSVSQSRQESDRAKF